MQFASDSPDLPEYLLAAAAGGSGAAGSGSGAALDATRTGLTPDVRAFSPPSLALSPPTPTHKQASAEPESAAAAANAAVPPAPATPDGGVSAATPVEGSEVDGSEGGSVDADAVQLEEKPRVEVIVDMSATGDWNGLSTLEKPRETDYDRPEKGWKTSLAKTFGFFLFFGLNAFLIAYLVPIVFKAMLGL